MTASEAPAMAVQAANINVGIMGHVDAGKTTLAKLLSTQASTAAFDKSPQSQERGITLDLGFSAGLLPSGQPVTFVDCPGHASLFRMVLGASQIIDAVILVVDVMKGLQTQTSECLVLAEIVTGCLLVALTKGDLIPETERAVRMGEIQAKLQRLFGGTKFAKAPMLPVSEHLTGSRERFLVGLQSILPSASRGNTDGPTIVAIDHCFAVRGAGTILTGTVLQGRLALGDAMEIPAIRSVRMVKSMQSFKLSRRTAGPADRVGINLGNLDASKLERTIMATPGALKSVSVFLIKVSPVRHYRLPCLSRSKMHISVLHQTLLATVIFLRRPSQAADWELLDALPRDQPPRPDGGDVYAWVETAASLVVPLGFLALGAKLDIGIESRVCRIAFYGPVVETFAEALTLRQRTFRWKEQRGLIDRLVDEHRLIGRDLAAKEGGLQKLIGRECTLETAEGMTVARAVITSPFGTSGKFNVSVTGRHDATVSLGRDLCIVVRYKKYLS